jgi:hypothetical protein
LRRRCCHSRIRESFSRRDVARDLLRLQLPPDLLAEIDIESLEIAKDSPCRQRWRHSYPASAIT